MHMRGIIAAMAALATSVVAAAAVPSLQARGSGGVCTSSHFEPVTSVGNSSGTPFCESKWGTTYLPITTITTWSDSSYVLGIQVGYSDGSESQIYGYTSGLTEMSIDVSYATDNFTILDLYQDLDWPYLNALLVTTKSGKIMNAGEPVYYFPTGYTQAVGSGILFGVSGTIDPTNGYLYSLGFQFLASPIKSIDVYNLQFGNLPAHDEDITPTTIDTASFYNNQTSEPENWTFQNAYATEVTYTFELQLTEAFNPSEAIMIGGGVPAVKGSSTTTFAWELQAMESVTLAYSNTSTLTWSQTGTVQPGHGVSCVAVYGKGVGNFPFNSTVTVNLENGDSYTFEESGTLSVKDASNAETECSDVQVPPPT